MTPSPVAEADATVRDSVRILVRIVGATASEMSELLGFGRSTWFDRQSGKTPFSVGEAAAIADYFGVPIDRLYAGPLATAQAVPPEAMRVDRRRARRHPDGAGNIRAFLSSARGHLRLHRLAA